jgi:hypothetical protein
LGALFAVRQGKRVDNQADGVAEISLLFAGLQILVILRRKRQFKIRFKDAVSVFCSFRDLERREEEEEEQQQQQQQQKAMYHPSRGGVRGGRDRKYLSVLLL